MTAQIRDGVLVSGPARPRREIWLGRGQPASELRGRARRLSVSARTASHPGGIRTYVSRVIVGFDVDPPLAASGAMELDGSPSGLRSAGGLPFTAAWRSRSA